MRDPTPPQPAFDLSAAIGAELSAAEQALALEDQTKRVHVVRVALKRARALARVARLSALDAPLREAMHLMADARDLAALAATARAEAKRNKSQASRTLKAAASSLERELSRLAPPPLDEVRARIASAYELLHQAPALSAEEAAAGAERVMRRARKARRKARHSEGEPRHRWRRREKDRLYLVALAAPLTPSKTKARARLTAKLCDLLGREHDLELLRERLGEIANKRADRALAKRQSILAERADALGRKVHRGGS